MARSYLEVPQWQSEEEDMRDQAMDWLLKVATEAAEMAEDISEAMDNPRRAWDVSELTEVEVVHYELRGMINRLVKMGVMRPEKRRV